MYDLSIFSLNLVGEAVAFEGACCGLGSSQAGAEFGVLADESTEL